MKTFSEFLDERFDAQMESTIKDTYEADMDRWYDSLDVQDVIDYGEYYGELMYSQGKIDGLNQAKEIMTKDLDPVAINVLTERN